MVYIAQLVRASDCDSEGRGFEPYYSPCVCSLNGLKRMIVAHVDADSNSVKHPKVFGSSMYQIQIIRVCSINVKPLPVKQNDGGSSPSGPANFKFIDLCIMGS